MVVHLSPSNRLANSGWDQEHVTALSPKGSSEVAARPARYSSSQPTLTEISFCRSRPLASGKSNGLPVLYWR